MIEINGVSKTYGGRIKALDNISLNIDSGCIYGFLGPNGAGKNDDDQADHRYCRTGWRYDYS